MPRLGADSSPTARILGIDLISELRARIPIAIDGYPPAGGGQLTLYRGEGKDPGWTLQMREYDSKVTWSVLWTSHPESDIVLANPVNLRKQFPGPAVGDLLELLAHSGMQVVSQRSHVLRSELLDRVNRLAECLEAFDESVTVIPNATEPGPQVPLEDYEGEERLRFRQHLRLERNSNLARKAKALHEHKCEVCEFDFEARFGSIGHDYIEAHH